MKKIILGLYLGLMMTGCHSQMTVEPEGVKTVKLDTVAVYGQKQTVSFPGKVKAASDINLAFRISGPILRMNAEPGSFVRQGQVLAEIDPRDYQTQLAATEAEYNRIKQEADRIAVLYEKESIAPNDYDKAQYGLQQITAKYNAHKDALADTRLCAPFDGYIQKRMFDTNETVGAGMPVIAMIASGSPEVEIHIPLADYIRQDEFDSFTCTVDVYPGVSFPAQLIGMNQKANVNQLYNTRLRVKSVDGKTPGPGMSATVTIIYRKGDSALVAVPVSALFEKEGSTSVWVYNSGSGTISARSVKPDEILSNGIVILSEGLSAGEQVVTAGVHSLQENQQVVPIPAVSSTNIGGIL